MGAERKKPNFAKSEFATTGEAASPTPTPDAPTEPAIDFETEQPFIPWLLPALDKKNTFLKHTDARENGIAGGVVIFLISAGLWKLGLIPQLVKFLGLSAGFSALFYGLTAGRLQSTIAKTIALMIFPGWWLLRISTGGFNSTYQDEFYTWLNFVLGLVLGAIFLLFGLTILIVRSLGMDSNFLLRALQGWRSPKLPPDRGNSGWGSSRAPGNNDLHHER